MYLHNIRCTFSDTHRAFACGVRFGIRRRRHRKAFFILVTAEAETRHKGSILARVERPSRNIEESSQPHTHQIVLDPHMQASMHNANSLTFSATSNRMAQFVKKAQHGSRVLRSSASSSMAQIRSERPDGEGLRNLLSLLPALARYPWGKISARAMSAVRTLANR